MTKRRLDALLVERGLFETRTKAQAALMAGQVEVEGRTDLKPGASVAEDAAIRVLASLKYVGRGGLKLEAALDAFGVDPRGRVCADIGASTGGFTDCLLQRGAAKVYAVDVGRGQLDAKLRTDPRVVLREGVNARRLDPGLFEERPDLAVVDVSFISLTKILAPLAAALARPFELVALVKPQFELSPKEAPKGVVKDEAARRRAVESVTACARAAGLEPAGEVASPIKGAKGNVEFLCLFKSPNRRAE